MLEPIGLAGRRRGRGRRDAAVARRSIGATVLTMLGGVAGVMDSRDRVARSGPLDPARAGAALTRAQWGMSVAHCGVGVVRARRHGHVAYNVELDRSCARRERRGRRLPLRAAGMQRRDGTELLRRGSAVSSDARRQARRNHAAAEARLSRAAIGDDRSGHRQRSRPRPVRRARRAARRRRVERPRASEAADSIHLARRVAHGARRARSRSRIGAIARRREKRCRAARRAPPNAIERGLSDVAILVPRRAVRRHRRVLLSGLESRSGLRAVAADRQAGADLRIAAASKTRP